MEITPTTRDVIGLAATHVDEIGGITLASYWPLIELVHAAVGHGDVVEIGSDRGFVTELLRNRCLAGASTLHAVDPAPARNIAMSGMVHHAVRSREFLAGKTPDAGLWIVDGDHNYDTVIMELSGIAKLISDRPGAMILHDVSWPWARRDLWYNPAEAPSDGSVHGRGGTVSLDSDGSSVKGIPLGTITAFRETQGGPGNGVLTAVDDFLAANPGWTFKKTPLLFGFGLLVRSDLYESERFAVVRSWMDAFELTAPVLASVEANRLRLLQTAHEHWTRADRAEVALARRPMRLAAAVARVVDALRGPKVQDAGARP